MRIFLFFAITVASANLMLPSASASPDPAKYPLRIHIFRYVNSHSDIREPNRISDPKRYIKGMGQADLFEGGEPVGFQFNYECLVAMRASGGYGTFPARWKKRGKTLEILLPSAGLSGNVDGCDLQADLRPGLVYFWKNREVAEEAATLLKQWMLAHKFNPEQSYEDPLFPPSKDPAADAASDDDPLRNDPD